LRRGQMRTDTNTQRQKQQQQQQHHTESISK
jgi:hypothetical protein